MSCCGVFCVAVCLVLAAIWFLEFKAGAAAWAGVPGSFWVVFVCGVFLRELWKWCLRILPQRWFRASAFAEEVDFYFCDIRRRRSLWVAALLDSNVIHMVEGLVLLGSLVRILLWIGWAVLVWHGAERWHVLLIGLEYRAFDTAEWSSNFSGWRTWIHPCYDSILNGTIWLLLIIHVILAHVSLIKLITLLQANIPRRIMMIDSFC